MDSAYDIVEIVASGYPPNGFVDHSPYDSAGHLRRIPAAQVRRYDVSRSERYGCRAFPESLGLELAREIGCDSERLQMASIARSRNCGRRPRHETSAIFKPYRNLTNRRGLCSSVLGLAKRHGRRMRSGSDLRPERLRVG